MDIVFGLWADQGAWPDHGGDRRGALGAPVVGPNGFAELLETMLGLSGPASAHVVRIAAWQAHLEAADDGVRFWSASFTVDPWSTARLLLDWRDQLVEAGWDACRVYNQKRLADLAAAELVQPAIPAGIADRIARLISSVDADISCAIRRVRLVDRRVNHSIGWRRLIDRLEAVGIPIEEIEPSPAAEPANALGRMQRWMRTGEPLGKDSDHSVTVAHSTSALLAAELMGHWFAGTPRDQSAVLVAQAGDTQLLDRGLALFGQPRAGRSRRSPYRGTLQLLLLAFELAWRPFDPRTLMDLLLFAKSPIAPRAAGRLAAALEEAPGTGGQPWLAAWADIEAAERAAASDARQLTRAEERITRWRAWVEPLDANPAEGLTAVDAVAICDRVVSWATIRHALDPDPLYLATATLAADVRAALVALNRPRYSRALIERVIDQALDEGQLDPKAEAEAAGWRSVAHPGAIWGPADTVVWWNFSDTGERASRLPWTAAERDELVRSACPMDDDARTARVLSAAWERAVLNARARLILVTSGLDSRSDETAHPLAHRIAPAIATLAVKARLEDALESDRLSLAGMVIPRTVMDFSPPPMPRPAWPTPAGFAGRMAEHHESATSFENLFACQLMWALRHVAYLRPGRSRSIPDENRLLGNLAHALARDIFQPGAPPPPRQAFEQTETMLDKMIDQLAAPLRQPEFAADMDFARRRLPEAMAELSRILTLNRLTVAAGEQQVSRTFEETLSVRGAIDLVAHDEQQFPVIIDLKWTRNAKPRFDELRGGTAVQLATYGALLTADAPYRAGYFLLNQRQFATLADAGLIGATVDGARGLPETWRAITDSWARWRGHASTNGLLATGVSGAEDHLPSDLSVIREVRCDRCDYSTLCRVRGLR